MNNPNLSSFPLRNEIVSYVKQQHPSQEAHDGSLLPDLVRLQLVELDNNPVNGNKVVTLSQIWTVWNFKINQQT